MDLDLNFEPLNKIDSDKESEIDESSEYESSEGDEGSENDVVNALSNQMSPLAASSIISSSQIVTKGSKGQLFKSLTNDKPARTSEFNLGIFFVAIFIMFGCAIWFKIQHMFHTLGPEFGHFS